MLLLLSLFGVLISSTMNKEVYFPWQDYSNKSFQETSKSIYRNTASINNLNLFIFGKTGVGKTTLTNQVFGEEVGESGIGEPVTEQITMYSNKKKHLTIFDTPGLEIDQDKQRNLLKESSRIIIKRSRTKNPNDYIHCIWYCISSTSSRIERSEINFIKKISCDYLVKIPVIIILTQCYNKKVTDEMINTIKKQNLDLPIVPVIAKDYTLEDYYSGKTFTIQANGLDNLINVMNECLPELAQQAFKNMICFSLGNKLKLAYAYVGLATIEAGTSASLPPFCGKNVLITITIKKMFAAIDCIFDNDFKLIFSFINETIDDRVYYFLNNDNNSRYNTVVYESIFNITKEFNIGGFAVGTPVAVLTCTMGIAYVKMIELNIRNEINLGDLSKQEFEDLFDKIYQQQVNELESGTFNLYNV